MNPIVLVVAVTPVVLALGALALRCVTALSVFEYQIFIFFISILISSDDFHAGSLELCLGVASVFLDAELASMLLTASETNGLNLV